MRRLFALLLVLLLAGLCARATPAQTAYAPYGCPPELASLDFPEPRVCAETQSWWMQGNTALAAPGANFAFDSTHVHGMNPFPLGERFTCPPAGSAVDWPYLMQSHNGIGATVRQVRAGFVGPGGSDTSIPTDPGFKGVKITTQDFRHAGTIPFNATKVNAWCAFTGNAEGRFTVDTTSPFGGNRQYNSSSFHMKLNQPGAPVTVRARGWYQNGEYVDVTLTTKVRASTLATTGLPSTLSYSLGSGATHAFAYIDPNIHADDKGTVLFENRTGSSGSFALPALSPGSHVLMLGAWEKTAAGWNAGVLRLPFEVNA